MDTHTTFLLPPFLIQIQHLLKLNLEELTKNQREYQFKYNIC